jgi:hypothetical protein
MLRGGCVKFHLGNKNNKGQSLKEHSGKIINRLKLSGGVDPGKNVHGWRFFLNFLLLSEIFEKDISASYKIHLMNNLIGSLNTKLIQKLRIMSKHFVSQPKTKYFGRARAFI